MKAGQRLAGRVSGSSSWSARDGSRVACPTRLWKLPGHAGATASRSRAHGADKWRPPSPVEPRPLLRVPGKTNVLSWARGARPARRDKEEYSLYCDEKQRSRAGWIVIFERVLTERRRWHPQPPVQGHD
jgi:hypothetical protein